MLKGILEVYMIDDNALIRAARKRILRELAAQSDGGHSNTINNYAGGGGHHGLMEAMNGGGSDDPSLHDYLVDIEKRDIPGEEGGKPIGWTNKVHRHREEKGGGGK